jgi:hypothetical protein
MRLFADGEALLLGIKESGCIQAACNTTRVVKYGTYQWDNDAVIRD